MEGGRELSGHQRTPGRGDRCARDPVSATSTYPERGYRRGSQRRSRRSRASIVSWGRRFPRNPRAAASCRADRAHSRESSATRLCAADVGLRRFHRRRQHGPLAGLDLLRGRIEQTPPAVQCRAAFAPLAVSFSSRRNNSSAISAASKLLLPRQIAEHRPKDSIPLCGLRISSTNGYSGPAIHVCRFDDGSTLAKSGRQRPVLGLQIGQRTGHVFGQRGQSRG